MDGAKDKRKVAKRIVDAIERDILDRRGLKRELSACDPDVRMSIRKDWEKIVLAELARPTRRRDAMSKHELIAAIEKMADINDSLESLVGEILATLQLNYERGRLVVCADPNEKQYPLDNEYLGKIIANWRDAYSNLTK